MYQSKIKQIREIKIKDIIIYFVIPLILISGIWVIYGTNVNLHYIKINNNLFLGVAIVFTYILARLLALGAVLVYKAFAPMDIRNRCRFEPCCSTYMMICLKKYGLIIGSIMGIKRIMRCRPPNGGVDYPQLFKFKTKRGENENGRN